MLHFQFPEYFIAFAALLVFIFSFSYVVRWKKKITKKIGDSELVNSLIIQYSPQKFRIKYWLIITAFILCVFASAGLVLPDKTQRITRNGTDLMVVLDVSKSMLATDVKPTRLDRAKQLISKIIDQMPDERIGLIVFAGRAYLQMPLTIDHKAARMYVASVSPADVPTQGTVISSALRMSLAAFDPKEKSYKSVLLVSDGEDHDKDAETAAKELSKQGIMVNTIGIGSPSGAPIPDEMTGQYKTDKEGNTVISRLNEQELQKIAGITQGTYQLYSDPDVIIKNIKNQLGQIEVASILSDSSYLSIKQYYWYFLIAAFVLLIIEMLTSEKRKKILKTTIMIVILALPGQLLQAQATNEIIKKGNRSFNEKQYDQAEEKYREAIEKSPENDVAHFNLGNTQYRKEKLDDAVKSYDITIQNSKNNTVKQNAFYNKGVAFQKAGKLPESILAYKNALLLNPADEDARQNLQRALKKQEEQQQQQQQNNKQDQKNNEDQKKKQDQEKQKQQQQPASPPPKLSKKDAEEKLKALADKERELQDKLRKVKGVSTEKPDKDW